MATLDSTVDDEKRRVMGSITEDGYCYLIWNKLLYLWSCNETVIAQKTRIACLVNQCFQDNNMPHAFKLQLPSTGLNYNVESVCVYKKGSERCTDADSRLESLRDHRCDNDCRTGAIMERVGPIGYFCQQQQCTSTEMSTGQIAYFAPEHP